MIIPILLAGAMNCVAPSDMSVVGFWESAGTTLGGIGHTLELKSDGGYLGSKTVIVDQVFRTVDGSIFVAEDSTKLRAATRGVSFKVTADALIVVGSDGGEVRKERLEGSVQSTASPIGAWKFRHYTGAIAFERYTDDGHLQFRLPMTSDGGCYRAASGTLDIARPEGSSALQYELKDGRLLLRSGGRETSYHRSTPWYPRDQLDYRAPKRQSDGRPGF